MSKNQIAIMADRLNIDEQDMHNIVVNTVMPARTQVSNEQFVSFMAVANEYKLNPLCREIYAFPAKGGGIQPIVSIDGWLNIINSQPEFDGMDIEFAQSTVSKDKREVPEWCKVRIYRKDRSRPVEVVEYMDECWRGTEPWKMKPRRMLQHKAVIQAGRYAFGISGIIDEDEKEAYKDAGVIHEEKDITPQPEPKPTRSEAILSRIRKKPDVNVVEDVPQDVPQTTKPQQDAQDLEEEQRNADISLYVESKIKEYDEAAGFPDKQQRIVELAERKLSQKPDWLNTFRSAIA